MQRNPQPDYPAVHLLFQETTSPSSLYPPDERTSPVTDTMHVVLAPHHHIVERGDAVLVRDFAARRVLAIHRDDIRHHSLFAEVGGRHAELMNRSFLAEAIQVDDETANPFDVVLTEHELSLPLPRKKSALSWLSRILHPRLKTQPFIDRSSQAVRFDSQRGLLAQWSCDNISVTTSHQKAFTRLVRYEFGGHPVILEGLDKEQGIPRELSIFRRATYPDTRLQLTSVKGIDEVEQYSRRESLSLLVDDTAFTEIVPHVSSVTPSIGQDLKRRLIQEATLKARQKLFLDSILTYFECSWIDGAVPPEYNDHRAQLTADPDVQLLLSSSIANRVHTTEEAKAALANLARLRERAPEKAHVVQVLEANIKGGDGREDLIQTLSKQPLLAGVWKDLGDIYYGSYEAAFAWECWNIARRIAPDHKNLASVLQLEAFLLSQYPEYF